MATDNTIRIQLPKPHPGQLVFLNRTLRHCDFICGRRYGKSSGVAIDVVESVLKPKQRIGYCLPTFPMMTAFEHELRGILKPVETRFNGSLHLMELSTGSIINFFAASDAHSSVRGKKFNKFYIDEVQLVKDLHLLITRAIYPTLVDYRGGLTICGTANEYGSDLHNWLESIATDKDWLHIRGRTEDNPYLDAEVVAQLRASIGEDAAAVEMDCRFIEGYGQQRLITREAWNSMRSDEVLTVQKVYAVDASLNSDYTVIVGVSELSGNFHAGYDDIYVQVPTKDNPIDFGAIETEILRLWSTGRARLFTYDPYQLESVAQRCRSKGVNMVAFTQSSMRVSGDSNFAQVLREGRFTHGGHDLLTEAAMSAVLKNEAGGVRIIKGGKGKIDAIVACAMAVWACQFKGGNTAAYIPAVGDYRNGTGGTGQTGPAGTYIMNDFVPEPLVNGHGGQAAIVSRPNLPQTRTVRTFAPQSDDSSRISILNGAYNPSEARKSSP